MEAIENRLQKLEAHLKILAERHIDDPAAKEILKELQAPLETPNGVTIKGRPQRRKLRRQQQQQIDSSSPEKIIYDSPLMESPSDWDDDEPTPSSSSTPSKNRSTDPDGSLSIDEHGQVRYLGNSSGFYLLSDSRTYKNGVFHFTGYYHRLKDNKQDDKNYTKKYYKVDPFELPSQSIASELLSIYFEHLYPVLPLFYKKNIVCLSQPEKPVSPLLLNAIYAIASRMSSNVEVRSDPSAPDTAGDIFFERAQCLLEDYYDAPRISTVQALLLLASHQMGAMKPAKAWIYGGMAFRMAQDLGLNRNCDHWDVTPDERERRKRVFWCCYIMDRFMCASYGRSATFDERDCDVPLPSVDDDEPLPCKDPSRPPVRLLEVFTQSVKMADILGHVLKNMYYAKSKFHRIAEEEEEDRQRNLDSILNTLHRQLAHWYDHLPPSLQYQLPNTQNGEKSPDPPSAICQLHLMYYTTVILLHRSFIPKQTQSISVALPCFKLCEAAATSIMDIVNIMLDENHLRYVYNFSVFYVFTAGIIFVKLAAASAACKEDPNRAFDAKLNTNRIMRALDNLENTWLNASRCCNILGELAGLRDIKLEVDKYVPKQVQKASPPPSIAVPNSPAEEPASNLLSSYFPVSSVREQQQPMDPFAQTDLLDPIDTAFWGMPSSLNMDDWDEFFGQQQKLQSFNGQTMIFQPDQTTAASSTTTEILDSNQPDPSNVLFF